MIDEIRTKFKLYPKHYSLPPSWVRKHFKLKKDPVPKYLLFRLFVAIAFGILAPISTIVCLCTGFNHMAIGIMLLAPCIFAIVDTVQFIITSHIFKKSK